MIDKQSKIKLFTHTDLDGVGCGIIGKMAFDNIDIEYLDYHNVNTKIGLFIEYGRHSEYEKVIVTDISVNREVANKINDIAPDKFILLDHHQTAEFLNEYEWAHIYPRRNANEKNSGTNMLFEFLIHERLFKGTDRYFDALTVFAEKVRRYDTWEWKEVYGDNEASDLNNLLYLVGRTTFIDKFVDRFNTQNPLVVSEGSWLEMFDHGDKAVLTVDRNKAKSYIDRKEKQMVLTDLFGYKLGVVFGEQYISELGNSLSERNKELDAIAIVDIGNKKVSLRTVHDHINLGTEIASRFGGGGHPKASGFQLSDDTTGSLLSILLLQASKKSSVLSEKVSKFKNFLRSIDNPFKK
ncbi:hypothetical protein P8891_06125 [Bacillus atrophaeus]|uniref:DHH family phosphoesterase n=1 Tax=Bacillus atrophaeus TaxID=1452 RepID=UPI00227F0801|nr:hypothetical protein [Bacillus atrophaeus]MCY7948044.1 hypothetical protein [Bacillus atrophaeus]MCY8098011.1 hypothetical protein [Bacillus atrophaeus]MCY9169935.1 hypothetical protein [Bacillus atrophaeus]MEC0740660.1 hypothetical protein [Bacillus atrophaeus]MEC0747076.1 hypothetical protein [Bacillus atrophaeus]